MATKKHVSPDIDVKKRANFKPGQHILLQPCKVHRPVQHRDRKVPWCGICGLDRDGQIPKRRGK
jgi:hypothetical protein